LSRAGDIGVVQLYTVDRSNFWVIPYIENNSGEEFGSQEVELAEDLNNIRLRKAIDASTTTAPYISGDEAKSDLEYTADESGPFMFDVGNDAEFEELSHVGLEDSAEHNLEDVESMESVPYATTAVRPPVIKGGSSRSSANTAIIIIY
jgi:hypothetical protein